MTITSVGYDGTIDEPTWAAIASLLGSEPVAVAGSLSIVTGTDRTMRLSSGSIYAGHGVIDTTTSNTDAQTATIVSGSRWDTLVLRRDWAPISGPGLTTLEFITGTTAKQPVSLTNVTPGVKDDTILGICRVQAGFSAVQEFVDLRHWASRVRWRIEQPAATDLDYGQAVLTINPPGSNQVDLLLRRGEGGSSVLQPMLGPYADATLTMPTTFTSVVSTTTPRIRRGAGRAWLDGQVKRANGASFVAGELYQLATISTALAPDRNLRFAVAAATSTGTSATAVVIVTTAGTITLLPITNILWAALEPASWFPKGS